MPDRERHEALEAFDRQRVGQRGADLDQAAVLRRQTAYLPSTVNAFEADAMLERTLAGINPATQENEQCAPTECRAERRPHIPRTKEREQKNKQCRRRRSSILDFGLAAATNLGAERYFTVAVGTSNNIVHDFTSLRKLCASSMSGEFALGWGAKAAKHLQNLALPFEVIEKILP